MLDLTYKKDHKKYIFFMQINLKIFCVYTDKKKENQMRSD